MCSRGLTAGSCLYAYFTKQPSKMTVWFLKVKYFYTQTELMFCEHLQYLYIIISKRDVKSRMEYWRVIYLALSLSDTRRKCPPGLHSPKIQSTHTVKYPKSDIQVSYITDASFLCFLYRQCAQKSWIEYILCVKSCNNYFLVSFIIFKSLENGLWIKWNWFKCPLTCNPQSKKKSYFAEKNSSSCWFVVRGSISKN